MSDFRTYPERREKQGNGGLFVLLAFLALALLGNFLGTGKSADGPPDIPPDPAPVPPSYAGPLLVRIDARGFWAFNADTGDYLTFLGPLGASADAAQPVAIAAMLGAARGDVVVDTRDAPHYAADGFIKALRTAGWEVSVTRD